MKNFIAVTDDLFVFVFFEWFGWRQSLLGGVRQTPALLPDATLSTARIEESSEETTVSNTETGTTVVKRTPLFVLPTVCFDGVLKHLSYGSQLNVLAEQNRWSRVEQGAVSGWIKTENLTNTGAKPTLKRGEFYGPDHQETEKLRSAIGDEFNARPAVVPLQDVEYVTHRLQLKEKNIPWPEVRPRTAGRWHELLRGLPGVHIMVSPELNSVMETVNDDGLGQVAVVEEVFPDETIVVSEVGWPEEGRYSERTLPKAEWREWRPVFIKFIT